jgi:hypothetical protein
MVRQPNRSFPAIWWHRMTRSAEAAFLLMVVVHASAPAAVAKGPITLVLPSRVTISLVSGKTMSGVRLTALGPSQVSYEKGGNRSLPVQEVKSISFSGPMTLEQKASRGIRIRGSQPVGCRGPRQMPIPGSALSVQSKRDALSLDPASLDTSVLRDLRQASSLNTLVVDTLRFDPDGKVQLDYKSCSPGQ